VLNKEHLATNDLMHEVKHLDLLKKGRKLENIILIDNSFYSCFLNFGNMIPAETYTGKDSK